MLRHFTSFVNLLMCSTYLATCLHNHFLASSALRVKITTEGVGIQMYQSTWVYIMSSRVTDFSLDYRRACDRPGVLDLTGKAKWDAWKALEGAFAENKTKSILFCYSIHSGTTHHPPFLT